MSAIDVRVGDEGALRDTGPFDRARLRWQLALGVFGVALAIALILAGWNGRHRWFYQDEWDFLAARDAGDVESLFRPHNQHWSTLPIVWYRLLFNVVGLRSYLPYQGGVIVAHLVAAALLRAVMRRAGTDPWVATVAAGVFALLGAGWENIIWGFQIGFVGALVFGLAHLLLADHDGAVDRRDGLGLVAGLASLMCAGVALAFVAATGLATLLRRGWRIAALHTLPLGVIFAMWLALYGSDHYRGERAGPRDVMLFAWAGLRGGFTALGQSSLVATAALVMLLVGVIAAYRSCIDGSAFRRRIAAPLGLFAATGPLLVIVGLGRAHTFGTSWAEQSRYLYLVSAMLLPILALAADALARRWRLLMPFVLAVLVAGIPGNVGALAERRQVELDLHRDYRRLVLTMPRLALANAMPDATRPEKWIGRHMTVGWLVREHESGALPGVATGRVAEATALLHLALVQRGDLFREHRHCERVRGDTFRLERGATMQVDAPTYVRLVTSDGLISKPKRIDPRHGTTMVALTGPLDLRYEPAPRGRRVSHYPETLTVRACTPRA